MNRAATFLAAGLCDTGTPRYPAAPRAIAGQYRAKVIGNGLRELDRFLNRLIDEELHRRGLPTRPGQRNTASKLERERAVFGSSTACIARLRALAHSRDCLFHCAGAVTRGDRRGSATLTAGWPETGGRPYPVGETLEMTAADLAGICTFYQRLARDIRSGGAASLDRDIPTARAA